MTNLPQKKKSRRAITERDYKILRFLWKWKAVSTLAIAKKFFPEIDPLSAFRRLQYLEADGYITAHEVEGRFREVWGLGDKGFQHIRHKLGSLEHKGHKSENPHHDFLATAFHLGEWLTHQPEYTQTYSEQQLRRIPMDLWDTWVPQSTLHRPDGYSLYFREEKQVIVAFETELSLKTKGRYESVVAFYDSQTSIQLVFWLIDSRTTVNSIKNIFQKYQVRDWQKHHFLLLKDFQASGWMAPFVEGRFRGQMPQDFLHPNGIVQASNWHPRLDVSAFLDSRRRPINTSPSHVPENSKIANRVRCP